MDEDIRKKLNEFTVGIAGLGGLGSNAAVLLARSGVGRLILADFDVVDDSNTYRQQYMKKQIGMKKTKALKDIIASLGLDTIIETVDKKLDGSNACSIFEDAQIIIEAFDDPKSKADMSASILKNTDKKLVACSGIAGYETGNTIASKKMFSNMYLIGDGGRGIEKGEKLAATRVAIAAAHQAHTAVRIMLGEE